MSGCGATADPRDARWVWAEVDLDAIAHNVGVVRAAVAPAAVWAVVKADAYGHGAAPVARAALDARAAGLCVAITDEGIALRDAGIDAPILVLSEQPPERAGDLIAYDLSATVYRQDTIATLAAAARAAGVVDHPVHIKLDTGMRRVGAPVEHAGALADAVAACAPALRLEGVLTHLPVADEPTRPETDCALDALAGALDDLAVAGHRVDVAHAANSAAGLAFPRSRLSLVRAGIAIYGIEPGPGVADLCAGLRPAMSLHARVSFVKRVGAGDGISYGLRSRVESATTVATVPIGYADGVPRRLALCGGSVLIRGIRRPIVGVVTMDQLMVECRDGPVEVGDEVILLGRQGDDAIRAEEWAQLLDTIPYEIVCGIGPRVRRIYRRAGADVDVDVDVRGPARHLPRRQ